MKSQKGFSLVELLLVVIIIGILSAIAIPNLIISRRMANEASAISALRIVHSAEVTYSGITGLNGTYADLAGLSGEGLIDSALATGTKSGYTITVSTSTGTTPAASAYCALASPISSNTGNRWFGVSDSGIIYEAANAGTITCTEATGTLSGGTVIE